MIIAVAVALLMVQTASAQQCFEHVLTVDRKYPNDGDCHDGILFQFHSFPFSLLPSPAGSRPGAPLPHFFYYCSVFFG